MAQHHRAIYRVCYGILRDSHEAEDVTQETFLRYWQLSGEVRGAKAWLITVARNKCLDRLRGRTTLPMAMQHAEVALRRHLGEDRLGTVTLVRRDGLTGVFRHDDAEWEVVVHRHEETPARLTCGVERLSPVPVHEVVSLRRL